MKQVIPTKFFGDHTDENINWMQHITLAENKISKQLGIIYTVKPYLNRTSTVSLYYLEVFEKETLAQGFSCEFCEISNNTMFYRKSMVGAYF